MNKRWLGFFCWTPSLMLLTFLPRVLAPQSKFNRTSFILKGWVAFACENAIKTIHRPFPLSSSNRLYFSPVLLWRSVHNGDIEDSAVAVSGGSPFHLPFFFLRGLLVFVLLGMLTRINTRMQCSTRDQGIDTSWRRFPW